MPTLSESLVNKNQLPEGYSPVTSTITTPPMDLQVPQNQNTFMRCPLPPIWQANPDSIRQFYVGGSVPQIRLYAQSLVGR